VIPRTLRSPADKRSMRLSVISTQDTFKLKLCEAGGAAKPSYSELDAFDGNLGNSHTQGKLCEVGGAAEPSCYELYAFVGHVCAQLYIQSELLVSLLQDEQEYCLQLAMIPFRAWSSFFRCCKLRRPRARPSTPWFVNIITSIVQEPQTAPLTPLARRSQAQVKTYRSCSCSNENPAR